MELLNLDVLREYGGALLAGLGLTVALTFVVIALALVLAIPVALLRMSESLALRTLAGIYVEVIRGTPLLLQLVYIYYVLPSIGINLNPIVAAIVGLTLNYTAYMSEVYRGGILAVPRNQWEAAATIGMTRARAFRRIILPLLKPGLLAGWIYVMIVSIRELSTSILLYSPDTQVVSIVVWELWENGQYVELSALGVLFIITLFVLVLIAQWLGRKYGVKE